MRPLREVCVALGLLAAAAAGAPGQEDFRNLDAGRPLRTEDAYPLKFLEWEWQLGVEGVIGSGERRHVAGVLELELGFARNWQLGLEVHPEWENRPGDGSSGGVAEFGAHVLFNLNQEGTAAPAVAVRADVRGPGTGRVGRREPGGRLLGIATRSIRRLRMHANAGYAIASEADGGGFWIAGAAVDYPIGLFSRSVLGDIYLEIPSSGERARVFGELGTRLQLTNVSVLDLGFSTRLDGWARGDANIGLVIGLSRSFGIPGLVRVPPYPDPQLW